MASIEERVKPGALWLDEHRSGWWQRIDLETLDLGDPRDCVLGQEYGRYANAPHEVWERGISVKGGFNAKSGDHERARVEFQALTRAWRGLVEQRRAEED